MDDKLAISVVADSGKEEEVWVAGVTDGWAQGQVRVKATEFIFIEVAYQVRIFFTSLFVRFILYAKLKVYSGQCSIF